MKKNLNNELNKKIKMLLKDDETFYNTIVLSGGGIRGLVHLGVLKYLEKKDILQSITTFVGTSVGALISALYLIGFTIDELYEFVCSIDMTDHINLNPIELLSNYGLDNGNGMHNILIKMFENKHINTKITLLELFNLTHKTLVLTTVCVNTRSLIYLSHTSYPNLELITAIQMTTAIPFLFKPILYHDKLYCDGGIIDNFPIKYCTSLKNVIGVCFESTAKSSTEISDIIDYYKNIITCCMTTKSKPKYYTNTLYIPINISGLAFDTSKHDKQILFETGYNYTKHHLKI
jgi:NTE family protein